MDAKQKIEKPKMLNYDPSDPDKMKLPVGVTCGDCRHIHRCKAMFGHVETDTYCDWSPSLFRAALTSQQEVAAPVGEFDDWPDFNEQAMGCGLEDRNITDRYEAMRYGWDEAMERVGERFEQFLAASRVPVASLASREQGVEAVGAVPVGVLCVSHHLGDAGMENIEFQPMRSLPRGQHLLYDRELPKAAPNKATEIIAKLRGSSNWLRQGFGNWKDVTSEYDRTPFEAADLLDAVFSEAKPRGWFWSDARDSGVLTVAQDYEAMKAKYPRMEFEPFYSLPQPKAPAPVPVVQGEVPLSDDEQHELWMQITGGDIEGWESAREFARRLHATPPMAVGAVGGVGAVPVRQIKQNPLWSSLWMDASQDEYDRATGEKRIVYLTPAPEQATTGSGQDSDTALILEIEAKAKSIYESWSSDPQFRPWQAGGNSVKQDEARRLARAAILSTASPAGEVKS